MRQKILIIDDVDAIHSLVKIRLKHEEVDWVSAFDTDNGISLAEREKPDLILLDVDMPGRDGFAACAALKSNSDTSAVPVIFLTASGSAEQRVRGLELGALDYVSKPFDPSELKARVRNGLRLKFMMDLLARKALTDGLTGLWNRVHFDHRLALETSSARRDATPLSCIMLDLDHFKQVNDRHGHPAGDSVLQRAAQLLTENCRDTDVCCRYGGEEFVVLCPNTAVAAARDLAERLRQVIEAETFQCQSSRVVVSCSLGVAEVLPEAQPSVVEMADAALYTAKHEGRNRVVVAAPGARMGPSPREAALGTAAA